MKICYLNNILKKISFRFNPNQLGFRHQEKYLLKKKIHQYIVIIYFSLKVTNENFLKCFIQIHRQKSNYGCDGNRFAFSFLLSIAIVIVVAFFLHYRRLCFLLLILSHFLLLETSHTF